MTCPPRTGPTGARDPFLALGVRWTAEGTNSRPFGPVPPTGRRVRVSGLILDRVADGKVVERWEQWDPLAMLQQLGLAQA